MRTSKKLALAGAMVVALLIGLATPAAAAGPFDLEVTGGVLDTVLGDFDLAPGSGPTPPCPDQPSTLALNANANPNTWTVSGAWKSQFQIPGLSTWYWANFSILSGSGAWSGSSPYALTGNLVFRVEIHSMGANCDVKGNLICRVTGSFALASGSSFTGTLPNANVGDVATLNATSAPLTASPCSGLFAFLNGTTASLVGVTMEVIP